MNILIIEDDQGKLGNCVETFQKRGDTWTIARSKASAMEAVKKETYDLIITDLGLPDKDGEEAFDSFKGIEILEELSKTKKTYVIIASRAAAGDGELTPEQEERLKKIPRIFVEGYIESIAAAMRESPKAFSDLLDKIEGLIRVDNANSDNSSFNSSGCDICDAIINHYKYTGG